MEQYLKKALPAVAGALVMLSSLSFADVKDSGFLAQNKEKPKKPMMSKKEQPVSRLEDRWNLFVFGEAMLTQADQDNMSLGVLNNSAPDSFNTPDHDASVVNMHWKWDWSFRVGIGGTMEHDHWKPMLAWTHFRNTANKSQGSTDAQSIIPNQWGVRQIAQALALADTNSVHGKWHVAAEILDLVVGREYCASKWLQMTPFGGLRTGFIFQEFDVTYAGGLLYPSQIESNTMKSRFWGIGPELGLILDFGLGAGVSVDIGGAFSIIHGFFNTSRFENNFDTVTAVSTRQVDLKNVFRATRAITDLCIGLKWKKSFARDRFEVGFRIAYEQHMFFQQNVFITGAEISSPGSHSGDLGFQGYSFGGMVAF